MLDNGHLLDQLPRRSGLLWKRIVHKEFGITPRTRCCWNSQKANVQFSVQQLHCVSKICLDAAFIHVVEVGQYFMTKDTDEQFFARACREYAHPGSDESSSQPKGWIQGNTRIGPVLEITTSYLYGKNGIEVRIWSLSEDNSQSWVRIFYGSNTFVINSNYNNTGILADLPEE